MYDEDNSREVDVHEMERVMKVTEISKLPTFCTYFSVNLFNVGWSWSGSKGRPCREGQKLLQVRFYTDFCTIHQSMFLSGEWMMVMEN